MRLIDVNPFIRFAANIKYNKSGNFVQVRDCRIFYMLSGNCKIFIDNKSYILDKNSLFYCCCGSRYKISSENEASIISLNFDLSLNHSSETNVLVPLEDELDDALIFRDAIEDSTFLNSHFLITNGIEFSATLNKILYEFSKKNKYYLETSCGLLKQLITELHRYELQTYSASFSPVNKVVEYIKNNFSKNISNKDLAQITGYHEYYLNRLFIANTGISMHKYILNLRMNEAQRLVLNTDRSLTEISESIGFNNYTYFSDYFKKCFGLSPSQYRNSLKNKI